MQITIYSVFPAGRKWSEWLSTEVLDLDDRESFRQRDRYHEDGRVLVFVHAAVEDQDNEGAARIEQDWCNLPDGVRSRVWWLMYSGGGYWNLKAAQPNVHYLRYPVGRESLSEDEKDYFRRFLGLLGSDEEIKPAIWLKLYPEDNVAAATLLGLLVSSQWTDIKPA